MTDERRPLSPWQKAWACLRLLARPALARKLGTLVTDGYLARTGWVRSVLADRIVGEDGEPLPWMTYPFIDFLGPRLHRGLRVFEYGSGASTLFLARRVGWVWSVEHDEDYIAAMRSQLPANARLLVRPRAADRYITAIDEAEAPVHVVIVDGLHRVECARAALGRLAPDGVLVLDDSELPEYAEVTGLTSAAGFRALDFWGLAPTRIEHRSTTLFYRADNVLGV